MATIKDVAREAGVGLGTASRALNGTGSVSEKSMERVMAAARKLDFVPNQMARNLKKQTTGCVALIIPTISHSFFSQFAFYCEDELYKRGYRLIIINSQDDRQKEISMLEMIKQQRVDGIIVSTHYAYDGIDPALPIVTIDGSLGEKLPCVTSDNYQASYRAVRWLYDHGARRIGCICGTTEAFSETSYRYQAYLDCIGDLGLEKRLYKTNFKHGKEEEIVGRFFARYPDVDAVFASSDVLALIAYNHVRKAGRRVPEDIQIVGFDGIMDPALIDLELTTVRQNIEEMARLAVDLVIKRINGESISERVEVATAFVVGNTTAKESL